MFEQDVKNFIQAEVTAGRLISADLTGVNETSLTAEARGYALNVSINKVEEKMFYFYMQNGNIVYKELIKMNPIV